MRYLRHIIIVVAVVLLAVPARAGWDAGVLPFVGYNSDLGLHYGLSADIFDYGEIFPEYRQRYYIEVSRYTGGQTLLHAQYDSEYLIPGVRTFFAASWQRDPLFQFYGLNGVEPYIKEYDFNKATRTARYAYRRSMIRLLADFQGASGGPLDWVAGVSFWHYGLSDLQHKSYDSERTLYREMVDAGVISPEEADGGSVLEVKAGLKFDTRDNEAAPSRGIWAEAYLSGSPDLSGEGYAYIKAAAHLRGYLPLNDEWLVAAAHLAYQGTVLGTAPFYTQQNISTLILRQPGTDGLGGPNTVRGLLAQRLVGDSYAWLNTELRIRLLEWEQLGRSWYLAINPFFDAGMVTRLYKGEELAAFYGRDIEDLRRDALRLHCGAGAGLKIAMDRNFIWSLEAAKPLARTDGSFALYLALNYIF